MRGRRANRRCLGPAFNARRGGWPSASGLAPAGHRPLERGALADCALAVILQCRKEAGRIVRQRAWHRHGPLAGTLRGACTVGGACSVHPTPSAARQARRACCPRPRLRHQAAPAGGTPVRRPKPVASPLPRCAGQTPGCAAAHAGGPSAAPRGCSCCSGQVQGGARRAGQVRHGQAGKASDGSDEQIKTKGRQAQQGKGQTDPSGLNGRHHQQYRPLPSPQVVVVDAVLGKLQPSRAQPGEHPGQQVAQPAGRRVGRLAQLGPAAGWLQLGFVLKKTQKCGASLSDVQNAGWVACDEHVRHAVPAPPARQQQGPRTQRGRSLPRLAWQRPRCGCTVALPPTPPTRLALGSQPPSALSSQTSLCPRQPAPLCPRQPASSCHTHSSSASTVCMTKAPRLPLDMGGTASSRCRTAQGGSRARARARWGPGGTGHVRCALMAMREPEPGTEGRPPSPAHAPAGGVSLGASKRGGRSKRSSAGHGLRWVHGGPSCAAGALQVG